MKKKILKIVSIITLSLIVILGMCSFTTVAPPDDDDNASFPTADNVYMPSMNINVGYKYKRITTTIDQTYYGYFYNPNCTVVYGDDVSLIKNFASDYLVASTMSFDYHSQSANKYPSQYSLTSDYLFASVFIQSDTPDTANFTGEIAFSGLQKISDIDPWCEVVFYDDIGGSLEFVDLSEEYYSLAVTVVNIEDASYSTQTYYYTNFIGDVVGEFNGINLRKVVDLVLNYNNVEADYIDYVSICPTKEEGSGLRSFDMIQILDVLNPVTQYSDRRYESFLSEYEYQIRNLQSEKTYLISQYKDLNSTYKDALDRIKELETGIENNNAIPLLFDGIYKTIYNVLTIFFNMDFFGAKLGTIVGLLLGAAIVIIILKVVL